MRKNDDERQAAIAVLREWMKPGDTVFTVLRHVSRSGMQREIGVVLVRPESHSHFPADSTVTVRHPEYQIGKALGIRMGKREGLIVGGCGMDMGFQLVYELSSVLFPDGFGVEGTYPNGSQGRPTSPAQAAGAVKIGAKFYGRNGDTSGWDLDGGYALAQRWL
jgi:hypothetical protein